MGLIKMKKKTKKILVWTCISLIAIIFVLAPFGIAATIYKENFGKRYESLWWLRRNLSEFPGLKAQRYTFESNKGQILTGYKYYKDTPNTKGVVVIAHGFGAGHNSYMDVADYFASNGYVAFAYDATGNDKSDGDTVEGMPQGLIDLDYAIRFVKSSEDFKNMPIMLFGHSWGAYSAGSVLNIHPDIKGVVMVAAFNKSIDILEAQGKHMAGDAVYALLPYLRLIEKVKFGEYAGYSCIDGLSKSYAKAMIIQSEDDGMVPYKDSYMKFYNRFKDEDESRFEFISYKDRGHNWVYYSGASKQYRQDLYKKFDEYVESLSDGLTEEREAWYMTNNMDKSKMYQLDTDLMKRMVSFYDTCIK